MARPLVPPGAVGLKFWAQASAPIPSAVATTTVSDNFNRANGGLGSNWIDSPSFTGLTITSNAAGTAAAAWSMAYWNPATNTFQNDQYAEVTVVSGSFAGAVVRHQSSVSSGYIAFANISTGQVLLYRFDSGSFNLLVTGATSQIAAGNVLRLNVTGSVLTTSINGVFAYNFTDATYASGQPGIAANAGTLDNWAASPGSVSAGAVTGTLAITQDAQTLVAAGSIVVGGTLSANQANQTIAATGWATAVGTLSLPQAANTIVAAGSVVVSGTLTIPQASQTLSATGWSAAVGTLTATQANQTLVSVGKVIVGASLSVPQASQTISSAGTVLVSGTLSVPQANQTLSAAGGITVRGTLSIPQAAQTLSASGSVISGIDGNLSVVQANQTLSASGNVPVVVSGTLNVAQANQIVSAAGTVTVRGTLSVNQAAETLSAAGAIIDTVHGNLNTTQANQTLSATGTVIDTIHATLSVVQGNQTLSAGGLVQWLVIPTFPPLWDSPSIPYSIAPPSTGIIEEPIPIEPTLPPWMSPAIPAEAPAMMQAAPPAGPIPWDSNTIPYGIGSRTIVMRADGAQASAMKVQKKTKYLVDTMRSHTSIGSRSKAKVDAISSYGSQGSSGKIRAIASYGSQGSNPKVVFRSAVGAGFPATDVAAMGRGRGPTGVSNWVWRGSGGWQR